MVRFTLTSEWDSASQAQTFRVSTWIVAEIISNWRVQISAELLFCVSARQSNTYKVFVRAVDEQEEEEDKQKREACQNDGKDEVNAPFLLYVAILTTAT